MRRASSACSSRYSATLASSIAPARGRPYAEARAGAAAPRAPSPRRPRRRGPPPPGRAPAGARRRSGSRACPHYGRAPRGAARATHALWITSGARSRALRHDGVMTALDTARARPRAFWGDARFFLGILLVVASVAGVWFVVVGVAADGAGVRREPHDRAGRSDLGRRRAPGGRRRSGRWARPTSRPTRSPTDWSRPARSNPASWCRAARSAMRPRVRTTSVVLRSAVDVPGSVDAGLGRRGVGGAAARARRLRRAAHPGRRRHGGLGDAGRLDDRRRLGRARARHPARGCRRHARRDGRRVGALGGPHARARRT